VADFDGDGRDDWYCIQYDGLFVRLSNGQAFEEMTFQGPEPGACGPDDWTFVDINADGRTDVTCRPNGYVGLSTGSAFMETGERNGWCSWSEFVPNPEDPDHPIEVPRSQMQAMDIDGDRAPELVCTFAGQQVRDVHVRKWNGEALGPVEVLEEQWCKTAVQGGDFDGDGKFELRCSTGAVLRAGAPNVMPDLMREATNGMGGRTTASYTPSSSFACNPVNKPPVRQVVASTIADDGRGGAGTTSYFYCDGRSDPAEGAFLGFGRVWTTLPCLEGESVCPVTRTLYSQELRSLGRPTHVRRTNGAGLILQEVESFFHPQTGPSLPRQALVKEVRTKDFSPSGGETKTTSVSYIYDTYGNVTQLLSHGEVTADGTEIPNDELQTDLTYVSPDQTKYVVDRVRLTEVKEERGQGPVLLKRVENVHDPDTFDLTNVKTSVLPGSTVLERTMGYEAGKLTSVTSELGAETTITYTADGLRPEVVTGPEGSVTTLWDALCDLPSQVTDPNGVTTTGYDLFCRPERTEGPLDSFLVRSYEGLGDPAAQHVRVESPGAQGIDYTEEYFDGLGRTYKTLRRGPGQDIVVERSYNPRGGLGSETAPFYAGDPADLTRYAYDAFDRLVTLTHPDDTTTTKSYGLWSETVTDAKQKSVTIERGTNRSVETTTIEGEVVQTTTTYDMLGRRRRLDDGHQNVWTWTYDSLGRITQEVDPDSGTKTVVYDDVGRTEARTDAMNQVVRFAYDTLGRPETKTIMIGQTAIGQATFDYGEPRGGYSNWGRLTTVTSPAGPGWLTTLQVDYDALGRVVRQTRSLPRRATRGRS
jgi:YD repeat-containing protein